MKFFIVTIFALTLNTAFASNILDCKLGSGFHGNVEIERKGKTLILKAAQGFAYEMAQNLLLPETASFEITFKQKECAKINNNGIECAIGSADITAIDFGNQKTSKFKGILDLRVSRTRGSATVELTISKDHRIAHESRTFIVQDEDGCKFNL